MLQKKLDVLECPHFSSTRRRVFLSPSPLLNGRILYQLAAGLDDQELQHLPFALCSAAACSRLLLLLLHPISLHITMGLEALNQFRKAIFYNQPMKIIHPSREMLIFFDAGRHCKPGKLAYMLACSKMILLKEVFTVSFSVYRIMLNVQFAQCRPLKFSSLQKKLNMKTGLQLFYLTHIELETSTICFGWFITIP